MVVKFVRRDKREEMNRNRRKLIGKNTLPLQLVREEIGKRIPSGSKIHINESLTAYGKRLLGKIHKCKQDNNFKFLWTANGTTYVVTASLLLLFASLRLRSLIIFASRLVNGCHFKYL